MFKTSNFSKDSKIHGVTRATKGPASSHGLQRTRNDSQKISLNIQQNTTEFNTHDGIYKEAPWWLERM